MANSLIESNDHPAPDTEVTSEDFATRLFSIVMFGVCAVILLMVVFANL